ncbi:unnamed protein product [Phytophthora fragariaefolia]|uniref:Unnamed protein product n=1 Tax=Phytophthora fragariaefolia TaxID=1490495 RepID=A0A9W6YHC5_9STRA|nr:unnamed protein product [Phytophthora fragariaefolia]
MLSAVDDLLDQRTIAQSSLALDRAGLTAARARLGRRDRDTRELPVGHDLGVGHDVVEVGGRTREARDGDALDGDGARGLAGVAALGLAVVGVDDDGVLDVRELVVRVGDVRDEALEVDDGLDADAVDAVDDGVALDREARDRVGRADGGAAERADGDAVAAAAVVVAEDGVGAGLHGETVVLVVDLVARDGHVVVLAQVEAVRVLGRAVTGARVERESGDGGLLGVEDAEGAVGRVLDLEARERGARDAVQAEEHGACDGRALLPVPGALAIQCAGTADREVAAPEQHERAVPLLLAERDGAGDLDGGARLGLAQVERDAGRDGERADGERAAGRDVGAGLVRAGERAAGGFLLLPHHGRAADGSDDERERSEGGGEELHGRLVGAGKLEMCLVLDCRR